MNTIKAGNTMKRASQLSINFKKDVESNISINHPQALVNEGRLTGKFNMCSSAVQLRARS